MRARPFNFARLIVVLSLVAIAAAILLIVAYHHGLPGPGPVVETCLLIAVGALLALTQEVGAWHDRRQAEDDAARYTRVGRSLPLRIHRFVGLGLIRRRSEVLAFYRDGVVVTRPPGPPRVGVSIDSVELVELRDAPSMFHHATLTVRVAGPPGEIRFPLSSRLVWSCGERLSELFGERFRHVVDPPSARRRIRLKSTIAGCAVMDVCLAVLVFWGHSKIALVVGEVIEAVGLTATIVLFAGFTLFWNWLALLIAWEGAD